MRLHRGWGSHDVAPTHERSSAPGCRSDEIVDCGALPQHCCRAQAVIALNGTVAAGTRLTLSVCAQLLAPMPLGDERLHFEVEGIEGQVSTSRSRLPD